MDKEMPQPVSAAKHQPAENALDDCIVDGPAQAVIDNHRRIRQAVVVIHGIGEQRPMDTLRSFVDAVLGADPAPEHGSRYRSKPDLMNETFETRCLQAPASRQRPLTDFYEYYWAHHMEGSKYTQVLGWLLSLLLRRPKKIPSALLPVYFGSWGLILLAAGLWAAGFVAAGTGHAPFFDGLLQQKGYFVSGLVTLVVQWVGSHFVLGYVADAARYLTPSPGNIDARNKIRSEGINLLQALHTSGKYNRIVVVGHSLGSVIGYDLIRNLWEDLRKPVGLYPQKQPELKGFVQEAKELAGAEVTPARIEKFQQCQHRLWQEYRRVGIPWLVTDFVTLGAPLAHAQLLMADDPADLSLKKVQYEYPCCPPADGEKPYYNQQYRLLQSGTTLIRNVLIPHHGAPFTCIRWTNLFFPYRKFLLGDLIGGPLNVVFGQGIHDIAVVPSTDKWLDRTLLSHVRYWTGSGQERDPATIAGVRPSLATLRKVLRLDFLQGKSAGVKPGISPQKKV